MTLAPIWRDLADKNADNDAVAFAKIDASMNQLEGLEVTDVPTVMMFPRVRCPFPLSAPPLLPLYLPPIHPLPLLPPLY